MGRALKYTLVTLLAVVAIALACVYGLYFSGARHIPANWKPTTVSYPDIARLALWRSLGGKGEPRAQPMSPTGYAWRLSRLLSGHRRERSPEENLAYATARYARVMAVDSPGDSHLMEAAATIRASRWPVERQLDTTLDMAWFGGDANGLREGATRIFGIPVEHLDQAQMHVLVALMQGPGYYDPWCHPERLTERVFATATRWNVPASPQQLEAALATLGPPPSGHRCAGQSK